jgi:hypothetical protein
METSLPLLELTTVKESVVYHVAPNKSLNRWGVMKQGKKALKPKAKGLSKTEAMDLARRLARKKAEPALMLIHKTRYIIEQQVQLSS